LLWGVQSLTVDDTRVRVRTRVLP